MRTKGKGNPKKDRSVRRVRPERSERWGKLRLRTKGKGERSKYDAHGNIKRERRVAQRP